MSAVGGLRGLALLASLGTLLIGCARTVPRDPRPPEAPAPDAVLFVTAALDGTLEPCGCSSALRGGLARTAQVIASARAEGLPVTWVDAGDALFPSPAAQSERARPQERARADTLARSMHAMGLAVRALGPNDRSSAEGSTLPVQLPTLSPLEARQLPPSPGRVPLHVVTGTSQQDLATALATSPAAADALVVALLPITLEQALSLDPVRLGIDLMVASGRAPGALETDTRIIERGGVVHVSLERRGRSLLRVDVARARAPGPVDYRPQAGEDALAREAAALDARIALLNEELDQPGTAHDPLRPLKREKAKELQARRAALTAAPLPALAPGHFSLRVVTIDPTLPEAPQVAALVAAHNAAVGALNLAWDREHGEDCPPPPAGRAAYVGNDACLTCHPDAGEVWDRTRHSHAWETLVTAGKQHHLDCIGCHVVGWQEAGGVCRLDRTAGRQDVGCESCHGPGSLHAATGEVERLEGRVDEARCRACHNAEHSPNFDFATWIPRVLGPGHGAPRR